MNQKYSSSSWVLIKSHPMRFEPSITCFHMLHEFCYPLSPDLIIYLLPFPRNLNMYNYIYVCVCSANYFRFFKSSKFTCLLYELCLVSVKLRGLSYFNLSLIIYFIPHVIFRLYKKIKEKYVEGVRV